jgi:hypothetical protein
VRLIDIEWSYFAVIPPSIGKIAPVIKLLSSLARNVARLAISSFSAYLPRGIICSNCDLGLFTGSGIKTLFKRTHHPVINRRRVYGINPDILTGQFQCH